MIENLPRQADLCEKEHWKDSRGTSFKNPWASFNPDSGGLSNILKVALIHPKKIPVPDNIHDIYRVVPPVWSTNERDNVRATWIGHATFVVELPRQHTDRRGIRILFDPVFSEYTSPALAARLGLGPKRYSKLPCTMDELPEIDVICLSHNHYDHLDLQTVTFLEARTKGSMQYLCGLNNRRHFVDFGVDPNRVHEMDWSDTCKVTVDSLSSSFEATCCPSQHNSARTPFDTDQSLWCSWLIKTCENSITKSKKVFFGGDTGYRSTPGDERKGFPTCPIFKKIGQTFGPLDLALLPIGLYSPRSFMSNVHCCPEDAVDLHVDIQSKKSVGMHFGTFRGGLSRNFEDVLEPPRRMRAYAKELGLPEDQFITIDIGGSVEV